MMSVTVPAFVCTALDALRAHAVDVNADPKRKDIDENDLLVTLKVLKQLGAADAAKWLATRPLVFSRLRHDGWKTLEGDGCTHEWVSTGRKTERLCEICGLVDENRQHEHSWERFVGKTAKGKWCPGCGCIDLTTVVPL